MSISNFFARHRTIESITAPITDIVEKLKMHAAIHSDAAQSHDIAAAVHTDLASNSKAEAAAASLKAATIASVFAL